jgi:hypothetical protein
LLFSLRLSIGYELYTIYPLFSMYFFSRSVVVLYLTIFTFVPFLTNLKCSHVSGFVSNLMPVTTRSQARRSRGIDGATLEISSAVSSPLSSNITFVNTPSDSFVFVPSNEEYHPVSGLTRIDESSGVSLSHIVDNVLPDPYHCSKDGFQISKFQTVAISNCDVFDTGPDHHNFSISNTSIKMEADCEDNTMGSTSNHGINDINSLFEALSNKLSSETSKISRDFQTVTMAHDRFKQEVRDELD